MSRRELTSNDRCEARNAVPLGPLLEPDLCLHHELRRLDSKSSELAQKNSLSDRYARSNRAKGAEGAGFSDILFFTTDKMAAAIECPTAKRKSVCLVGAKSIDGSSIFRSLTRLSVRLSGRFQTNCPAIAVTFIMYDRGSNGSMDVKALYLRERPFSWPR